MTDSSPTTSPTSATVQDPYQNDPRLSPLEADVLREYRQLRANLDALSQAITGLASAPSTQIAEGLRLLERKTALVCTALKASVYGIVLQQQIDYSGNGDGQSDV
ncbi:MAG: hypothetical protein M1828_003935 [Chrysothrix sp. TS-e1954]|nr:MAG: hypothetical protein M1828_003935 [Chrysothrix sp. TS-e1954]